MGNLMQHASIGNSQSSFCCLRWSRIFQNLGAELTVRSNSKERTHMFSSDLRHPAVCFIEYEMFSNNSANIVVAITSFNVLEDIKSSNKFPLGLTLLS
jgi:hypothetical protein